MRIFPRMGAPRYERSPARTGALRNKRSPGGRRFRVSQPRDRRVLPDASSHFFRQSAPRCQRQELRRRVLIAKNASGPTKTHANELKGWRPPRRRAMDAPSTHRAGNGETMILPTQDCSRPNAQEQASLRGGALSGVEAISSAERAPRCSECVRGEPGDAPDGTPGNNNKWTGNEWTRYSSEFLRMQAQINPASERVKLSGARAGGFREILDDVKGWVPGKRGSQIFLAASSGGVRRRTSRGVLDYIQLVRLTHDGRAGDGQADGR